LASASLSANALLLASDRNLYGTTNVRLGKSFIFKATQDGVVSVFHEFSWVTDGAPNSLIQASDGSLYGTTLTGGGDLNSGTIFKLSLSGTFTVVHVFQRWQSDGAGPVGLVEGRDGNLYGTTLHGGRQFGTLFRVTPGGRFVTVRSFAGNDGGTFFPLTLGRDGNLYGARAGAALSSPGGGIVFRIIPE
jgi:uncharacterized repeat protein (TIGR03803 family)